jgi:dGTPase
MDGPFSSPLTPEELTRRRETRREDLRGHYFRDTTAILHSYPFRRLKHKTQVFYAPNNDHICTRIEHVMHVASIASAICRPLGLDGDLAWAIGLGHDLGHTPFGHLGEKILDSLWKEGPPLKPPRFYHELYSLRVVDNLCAYGRGLNLCYAVRDGIVTHCGEKFEKHILPDCAIKNLEDLDNRRAYPATWEGAVVRMSDKIAYLGRDLEDAVGLGLIDRSQIPAEAAEVLGTTNGEIINNLVLDLIAHSQANRCIGFSDPVYRVFLQLKDFNYRRIYAHPSLNQYNDYFKRILYTLYGYLLDLIEAKNFDGEKYQGEKNFLALRFGDYVKKMENFYVSSEAPLRLIVLDYLAGMTDNYALDCIREIMLPGTFERQFGRIIIPTNNPAAGRLE